MVHPKTRYTKTYFGYSEEGLKDSTGYSDYLQKKQKYRFDEGKETESYNPELRNLLSKLSGINLTNLSVLDIGGAIGLYSEEGKKLGIRQWDVLELNIDGWCEENKLLTVDNFITGDAVLVLPTMTTNQYDVIFSSQFLECLTDAELVVLIPQMNRVAKTKQIHIITEDVNIENRQFYNLKTLDQWKSLGFKKGTILIGHNNGQVVVV